MTIMEDKTKYTGCSLRELQVQYLDLLQSCLTGRIYRDRPMAPFNEQRFDACAREYGLDWPARGQTMIGERRIANLRQLTESVLQEDVPGDLIETGVWRGGACILMRAILHAHNVTDRFVWAADSYAGLPPPNEQKYPADIGSDFHKYRQLAVSLEEVKRNFAAYGLLDQQVKFIKGLFSDSLPTAPIAQLALMRLDGDMYESTLDALISLYPKLSNRGYVIVDDYGVVPACKAAVHDYCDERNISPNIIDIDGVGAYWRKTDASGITENVIDPESTLVSQEMTADRVRDSLSVLRASVIVRLGEYLAEQGEYVNRVELELLNTNQKLAALKASRSWRITKPLRTVGELLDKFIAPRTRRN